MEANQPLPPRFKVEIALGILLSFVTCGIYNVIWNKKQFEALNILLGREEFKFGHWLLLSLLTCGLFHIYYEYKMGRELAAYLNGQGVAEKEYLPVFGLLLSCFGLTVIADAIYQLEINHLIA